MNPVVRVVAAALVNEQRQVCITRRPKTSHQGGLWEFPGGKIEAGEGPEQALARELEEELGLSGIGGLRPLIRVRHEYDDKTVELDVWRVTSWQGEPFGAEQQPLRWARVDDLALDDFPAANHAIIRALQLPTQYAITPEPEDPVQFLHSLQALLKDGPEMVRLRAPRMDDQLYAQLVARAAVLVRVANRRLIIDHGRLAALPADIHGVHLTAKQLMQLQARPLPRDIRIGASCHNAAELEQAARLQLDFAVLSPVDVTRSHPDVTPLGWPTFEALCHAARLPVYALGGIGPEHLEQSIQAGAQGVAGITCYWPEADGESTLIPL